MKICIFLKIPKTFLLISQQLNISQRQFSIQNERENILYHPIYRPFLQLFHKLIDKANKMLYFDNFEKIPYIRKPQIFR